MHRPAWRKLYDGHLGRFRDPKTGAYVGHDEPSVKFISSRPGSGNTMSYGMQLARDPGKGADRVRQRDHLRRAQRGAMVRPAHLRREILPAESV